MRSRPAPITGVWNSQGRIVGDSSGNEHGFVTREHRLTERDNATSIVLNANVARRGLAVGLARERFLNVAAFVTIQTAVLVEVSHNSYNREDGNTIDFG